MIFKDLGVCRSSIKSASLIFVLIASAPLCLAQADEFAAFLHESLIREWAIEKVMPAYPEEAVKAGISGVVRLKLEISADGEVLRIKAYPKTAPLLKKAACETASKWRFKLDPSLTGHGRSVLSRLTFTFAIKDGQGLVGLYDPGPNAPDHERLGYYNSPSELREWKTWQTCPN